MISPPPDLTDHAAVSPVLTVASKSWVWFSLIVVILFVIDPLNTGVTVNSSVSTSLPFDANATTICVSALTFAGRYWPFLVIRPPPDLTDQVIFPAVLATVNRCRLFSASVEILFAMRGPTATPSSSVIVVAAFCVAFSPANAVSQPPIDRPSAAASTHSYGCEVSLVPAVAFGPGKIRLRPPAVTVIAAAWLSHAALRSVVPATRSWILPPDRILKSTSLPAASPAMSSAGSASDIPCQRTRPNAAKSESGVPRASVTLAIRSRSRSRWHPPPTG